MITYEIIVKKIENSRIQNKFKINVDESLNLNSHQIVYYNPHNKTSRFAYKRRTVKLDDKIKEQVFKEMNLIHEILSDYQNRLH